MDDTTTFRPARRKGTIYQIIALSIFGAVGFLGLQQAAYAPIGLEWLLAILPVFVSIVVVPFLIYRLVSLQRARYVLSRDGVGLHWGLVGEVIPMHAIQWVHHAQDLPSRIVYPWLRWPGSVLGRRSQPGGETIEYLAGQTDDLVVIGTPQRIFAISPAHPQSFMSAFQRYLELGSLSPLEMRSMQPTTWWGRIWNDRLARYLLLAGLLLSLSLFVCVIIATPLYGQVHLGFRPTGTPGELAPAARLLLLPLLNAIQLIAVISLGLFYYRHVDRQYLAYLLWGSGVFCGFLFLMGIIFILRSGSG